MLERKLYYVIPEKEKEQEAELFATNANSDQEDENLNKSLTYSDWTDSNDEFNRKNFIRYRPFPPIARETLGIFKRSWWDKTWRERHLLFQVFVNVTGTFCAYSLVFIIAVYFSVFVYKNELIRTIHNAITQLGIA